MKNMDKGITVPKMVLIKYGNNYYRIQCRQFGQKYPKWPRSTQAQNFWISMKKCFIGRPQSVAIIIQFDYFSIFSTTYRKNSREIKPWCGEPTSKKLELLFGTSPLAFNGLPVMAIDFGRALFRISPSMSISRAASPPEIQPKIK